MKLKELYQPFLDLEEKELVNIDMLFNFLLGMFEYKGFPDTFRPEYFERYLMLTGQASATKDDFGNWWATRSTISGDIDPNGIGNTIVVSEPNLSVSRYFDDNTISHCWNNKTHTPLWYIVNVGSLLSEIDLSIDVLTVNSRAVKGFIARNEKVKVQLENYFKNLKKGIPYIMFSENILEEVLEKDVKDIEQIDFKNESVHDFQFLINAHDSTLRWFMNFFGHAQQNSNKLAQQSVDEIKDSNSASLVLPTEMLKERQKFVEDFNAKTGLNCSIEFSELWKNEVRETINEGGIDNANKEDSEKVEEETTKEGV